MAEGRLAHEVAAPLLAHLVECHHCRTITFPGPSDTLPGVGGPPISLSTLTVTEEAPGRYELVRELGRGGQAVVNVAFDHHLGREVAMKVPHLSSTDSAQFKEQAVLRFLREARITALLEHPNIVPIHEIGRRADGSYYCTQRLIRHGSSSAGVRTLGSALREATSLEARIALLPHFVAVCNAVAHAHTRGVLHRDLKPDNIVIGTLGETVLLDWGLARIRGESGAPNSSDGVITIGGRALGTPSYMSPEQARGDPSTDQRTDVWSLGAMLYEILCGFPPFTGDNAMEVVARVQSQPVVPVLERSSAAPRALAAVAMRALERDPAVRYHSAEALGEEVSAWLVDLPVHAYRYSLFEHLRLLVARNRTAAVVMGVAFALLAASSALVFRNLERARSNLAEVFVARARSAEDKYQWDAAAAYYAAARIEVDREDARYGAMLAANRAEIRVRRLSGHTGKVMGLARSPDGKTLASAGFDQTVRLWNVALGVTTRVLAGHQGPVTGVAFSPDGRWLASSSEDKTVRLWELSSDASGEVIARSKAAFNAVAFSPDSTALAIAAEDDRVYRVVLADRSVTFSLPMPTAVRRGGPQYAVAFSPSGAEIVSGGWDYAVRIWSADGRFELLRTLTHHNDSVLSLRYSPDGKMLATAARDGAVLLYAADTLDTPARLEGHEQKVYSVDFSPDGRTVASGSTDKSVRLWLAALGEKEYGGARWRTLVSASYARDHEVNAVAFVDDATLAWAGSGGEIFVRSLESRPVAVETAYPTDALVVLPKKQLLLFPTIYGFSSYQLGDSTRRPTIEVSQITNAYGLSVSPDETLMAAGCGDQTLCWVNFGDKNSKEAVTLRGTLQVTSTAFSPDGRHAAVSTRVGPILVFEVATRAQVAQLQGHAEGVFSVAFSPDGKTLASASYDKTIRLWNTAGWSARNVLKGHEHGVRRVVFSPDGKLLASASWDRTARLWDVATGKAVAVLEGHVDQVFALAFSPDGQLLATGSWDGTVRLWSLKTYAQLARYVSDEPRVFSLAFSLDGKSLYCGGIRPPHRLDFKPLPTPDEALERSGFTLEGSRLVRKND